MPFYSLDLSVGFFFFLENKTAGWAGKRQGSLQQEEVATSHSPGLSV